MSDRFQIECLDCGHRAGFSFDAPNCPRCGSEWREARYDYAALGQSLPLALPGRPFDLWRYAELLPLNQLELSGTAPDATATASAYHAAAGNTARPPRIARTGMRRFVIGDLLRRPAQPAARMVVRVQMILWMARGVNPGGGRAIRRGEAHGGGGRVYT